MIELKFINQLVLALIKHSAIAHMHFRLGYLQPRMIIDEESEHFQSICYESQYQTTSIRQQRTPVSCLTRDGSLSFSKHFDAFFPRIPAICGLCRSWLPRIVASQPWSDRRCLAVVTRYRHSTTSEQSISKKVHLKNQGPLACQDALPAYPSQCIYIITWTL